MGLTITGTGSFLPEFVATNREYERFLDTTDEWILARTGIRERRINLDLPTWKMGELAAQSALEAAGIGAGDIDLVLCTSTTGDYLFPSMACIIQGALGAENAFAIDMAAACAGSVTAMDMARRYLATGDVSTALIVSSESLSQVTDYTDRGSCILFGDGAGAAVLTGAGSPVYGSSMRSDPGGGKHLYAKRTRRELPFSKQAGPVAELFDAPRENLIVTNGHEVYKFATRAMPLVVREACQRAGVAVEELDLIIPHQANIRIIETAAKLLKFPMEKVAVNIDRYGNTSSATVMICLDECVRQGRLRRGHKVCMVGFGAGLAYGAVVFEY